VTDYGALFAKRLEEDWEEAAAFILIVMLFWIIVFVRASVNIEPAFPNKAPFAELFLPFESFIVD
jgi:hypothetical protein